MNPNNKSIHILIAEDNRVSRELIKTILEEQGYRVYEAAHADEAIKVINDNAIDMAFVDINMQPRGGFELIRHLISEGTNLPMVIVTGETSGDILIKAQQYGIQKVLRKPVEPSRIINVTEQVLRRAGHNRGALPGDDIKTSLSEEEIIARLCDLVEYNKGRKHSPHAAIIMDSSNFLISEGISGLMGRVDPIAHAEISAIRKASEKLDTTDLSACRLYSIMEPTDMGKALIKSVGIKTVKYLLERPQSTHNNPDPEYVQLQSEKAQDLLED